MLLFCVVVVEHRVRLKEVVVELKEGDIITAERTWSKSKPFPNQTSTIYA